MTRQIPRSAERTTRRQGLRVSRAIKEGMLVADGNPELHAEFGILAELRSADPPLSALRATLRCSRAVHPAPFVDS
jgi:hypothetical protein